MRGISTLGGDSRNEASDRNAILQFRGASLEIASVSVSVLWKTPAAGEVRHSLAAGLTLPGFGCVLCLVVGGEWFPLIHDDQRA